MSSSGHCTLMRRSLQLTAALDFLVTSLVSSSMKLQHLSIHSQKWQTYAHVCTPPSPLCGSVRFSGNPSRVLLNKTAGPLYCEHLGQNKKQKKKKKRVHFCRIQFSIHPFLRRREREIELQHHCQSYAYFYSSCFFLFFFFLCKCQIHKVYSARRRQSAQSDCSPRGAVACLPLFVVLLTQNGDREIALNYIFALYILFISLYYINISQGCSGTREVRGGGGIYSQTNTAKMSSQIKMQQKMKYLNVECLCVAAEKCAPPFRHKTTQSSFE